MLEKKRVCLYHGVRNISFLEILRMYEMNDPALLSFALNNSH